MRFLIVFSLLLVSCSPYSPKPPDAPLGSIPEAFSNTGLVSVKGAPIKLQWWREFNNVELNTLIENVLASNYSLKAAWKRLEQARALSRITGSQQFPQVNISPDASRTRTELKEVSAAQQARDTAYRNNFSLGSLLSFEIDLWKRIASETTASQLRAEASRADVENTALLLVGTTTEIWLRANELKSLMQLLYQQIEASKQLLELTELRFAVGKGSALDVLQQRQQLKATELDLPALQAQLDEALFQLAVLQGIVPNDQAVDLNGAFPALPDFPDVLTPADLLYTRPDLRSAMLRSQASEYDIAAAVANRFPKLALNLNYNFSAADVADLFTSEVGSIASNAVLPLIDGGRRRAVVDQSEAAAEELLYNYSELYLNALRDVEVALSKERNQKDLVEELDNQLKLAQKTLEESKSRYANGLSDYLQVIVSLQALQAIERRVISENRSLLVSRAQLYRAIGGSWTQRLEENNKVKST